MKRIMIVAGLAILTFLNSCVVEGHARHHRHGVGAGVYMG